MSKPSIPLPQSASCACGAVTVTLSAQPARMLVCSCRDCQKASGGAHAPLLVVPADGLAVEGHTTEFSVTANSGATTTRHFCPTCGTPTHGESSRFVGLRLVPVGLFGDTPWFAPTSTIFYRSHQVWDLLPDVPHYDTYKIS